MSRLTLTLEQPAQVGDRSREDFVLSTMEYLPGSVVRGAFAAAWIARHGAPLTTNPRRQEFLDLFEGGVRFGALLPQGAEDASLSVVSHKYAPQATCADIEFDQAITDDVPLRCRDCGSPLEQQRYLRGTRPQLKRRTSVAIHESGVARRGQLFTRETMAEKQEFNGTITATDPGCLKALADLDQVRVGGRRTTHGLASVTITDQPAPPAPELREDGLLVLRLRSPGVFTDDHGRPVLEPGPAMLERVLGTPARVVRRWTRWQQAGGWHIASGLPKPAELTVAAGSVFLISCITAVAGPSLTRLAERGIGLRRHEGFGDLALPPVLREGRKAQEDRALHRKRVLDSVAPLRGVQLRWPDEWLVLRQALIGHVNGDPAATQTLSRMPLATLDSGVSAALRAFLALPLPDAGLVVEELTR